MILRPLAGSSVWAQTSKRAFRVISNPFKPFLTFSFSCNNFFFTRSTLPSVPSMLETTKISERFAVLDFDYRRQLQGGWHPVYLLSKATLQELGKQYFTNFSFIRSWVLIGAKNTGTWSSHSFNVPTHMVAHPALSGGPTIEMVKVVPKELVRLSAYSMCARIRKRWNRLEGVHVLWDLMGHRDLETIMKIEERAPWRVQDGSTHYR